MHRQAFVFVRRATAVLDPQDLARLARIREQFGPFFSRATENRMTCARRSRRKRSECGCLTRSGTRTRLLR